MTDRSHSIAPAHNYPQNNLLVACSLAAFLLLVLEAAVPFESGSSCQAEDKVASPIAVLQPAAVDIDADSLVAKVVMAYGGRDALAQAEAGSYLIGKDKIVSASGGTNELAFRQIRKGDKLRFDLELAPLTGNGDAASYLSRLGPLPTDSSLSDNMAITTFDGTSGWTAIGKNIAELPADAVGLMAKEQNLVPAIFLHLHEPGYKFVLVGKTYYKQVPVYAINFSRDNQSPITFFIDQNNFSIVAASYTSQDKALGTSATVTNDYSQYRPVASTLVPFKQTQFVNDKLAYELNIDTAMFPQAIDDAVYQRPDKSAAMHLTKPVVIPFEYANNEIIIKGNINDSSEVEFLFDTGASQTIVDRRIAAELLLDRQSPMNLDAAGGNVSGESTQLSKLKLDGITLENVQAMVMDLSPQCKQLGRLLGGIIGTNVLSQFAVTFDYGKSQITLRDQATYQPSANATVVPFAQRQGPIIKAVLNGKSEYPFLMDTGSAFNHLSADVAKACASAQPSRQIEATGVDGKPIMLQAVTVDSVLVGKQLLRGVPFTYTSSSFEQPPAPAATSATTSAPAPSAQAQSPALGEQFILGNLFWQHFLFTVDYKSQRIALQINPFTQVQQEIKHLLAEGDTKTIAQRDYRAGDAIYNKALASAITVDDDINQARILGRLGNLHRIMAKDLGRNDQTQIAYDYFHKALKIAQKLPDKDSQPVKDVQARILGDWSLLYSDSGDAVEGMSTMQSAYMMSATEPQVNVDYAVIWYRSGNLEQMKEYVDKAIALDPTNWQALWFRVKLADMAKNQTLVHQTLKDILRYYPWSQLAKQKLAPPPADAKVEHAPPFQ